VLEQTDFTITWTTDDVSAVDEVYLEYSPDGGESWVPIDGTGSDGTVNNTGSYEWSVPESNVYTDTSRLRLTATDAAGRTTEATSDAFTVQALPNPATALSAQ